MTFDKAGIQKIAASIIDYMDNSNPQDAFPEKVFSQEEAILLHLTGTCSLEDVILKHYAPWLQYSDMSFDPDRKPITLEKILLQALVYSQPHFQCLRRRIDTFLDKTVFRIDLTEDERSYSLLRRERGYFFNELVADFRSFLSDLNPGIQEPTIMDNSSLVEQFIKYAAKKLLFEEIKLLKQIIGGNKTFNYTIEIYTRQSHKKEERTVYAVSVQAGDDARPAVRTYYLIPHSEIAQRIAKLPELKINVFEGVRITSPHFLGFVEQDEVLYDIWASAGSRNFAEEYHTIRRQEIRRVWNRGGFAGAVSSVLLLMGSACISALMDPSSSLMEIVAHGVITSVAIATPIVYGAMLYRGLKSRFPRRIIEQYAKATAHGISLFQEVLASSHFETSGNYCTPESICRRASEAFQMFMDNYPDKYKNAKTKFKEGFENIKKHYSAIGGILAPDNEFFFPAHYLDFKTQNVVIGNPPTQVMELCFIDNDLAIVLEPGMEALAKFAERPWDHVFNFYGLRGIISSLTRKDPRAALQTAFSQLTCGVGSDVRLIQELLARGRILNQGEYDAFMTSYRDAYEERIGKKVPDARWDETYHAAAFHVSLMNIGKAQRNNPDAPNIMNQHYYSACTALYHLYKLSLIPTNQDDSMVHKLYHATAGLVECFAEML